jgi:hypothetical protein
MTATATMTGGCQCGAIRYRVAGAPQLAAVCHCRMCQKATGSIAWPFFTVRRDALTWTRGEPSRFRSSAAAQRGFCAACGTPLTFEMDDDETIDLSIGTLDDPAAVEPTAQYWVGSRMPWYGKLAELPVQGLGDNLPADEAARRASFQHPDHDTTSWAAAPSISATPGVE